MKRGSLLESYFLHAVSVLSKSITAKKRKEKEKEKEKREALMSERK
jgi:hypothetical protein